MQAAGARDVVLVKGHSGAFEIARDDIPLYSKLQTGRFPTDEEIRALV